MGSELLRHPRGDAQRCPKTRKEKDKQGTFFCEVCFLLEGRDLFFSKEPWPWPYAKASLPYRCNSYLQQPRHCRLSLGASDTSPTIHQYHQRQCRGVKREESVWISSEVCYLVVIIKIKIKKIVLRALTRIWTSSLVVSSSLPSLTFRHRLSSDFSVISLTLAK